MQNNHDTYRPNIAPITNSIHKTKFFETGSLGVAFDAKHEKRSSNVS